MVPPTMNRPSAHSGIDLPAGSGPTSHPGPDRAHSPSAMDCGEASLAVNSGASEVTAQAPSSNGKARTSSIRIFAPTAVSRVKTYSTFANTSTAAATSWKRT